VGAFRHHRGVGTGCDSGLSTKFPEFSVRGNRHVESAYADVIYNRRRQSVKRTSRRSRFVGSCGLPATKSLPAHVLLVAARFAAVECHPLAGHHRSAGGFRHPARRKSTGPVGLIGRRFAIDHDGRKLACVSPRLWKKTMRLSLPPKTICKCARDSMNDPRLVRA